MRTTIQYSNLGGTDGDGFHVTSDRGRYITGTRLLYNFVHSPIANSDAHADGVQVRGATDMSIHCNTIDAGPYASRFNASVYLEDANGGESDVSVTNNWLYGYAWGVMLDSGPRFTVSGNHFGGDIHWGVCYMNKDTVGASFTAQNNVDDRSGQPVLLPSACNS
jgi:hypothetical protein